MDEKKKGSEGCRARREKGMLDTGAREQMRNVTAGSWQGIWRGKSEKKKGCEKEGDLKLSRRTAEK